MNELEFFDYVTLAATALVVGSVIVIRIKHARNPTPAGGGSCSKNCCPTEDKENCSINVITIDDISGKNSK